MINVPIIGDGALLGYVLVQFLYGLDAKAEHGGLSPDAVLMDETFRTLYGDRASISATWKNTMWTGSPKNSRPP